MENYLRHVIINAKREREQRQQEREEQEDLLKFKKYLSETCKFFKNKEYAADFDPNMRRLSGCMNSLASIPKTMEIFDLLQNCLHQDAIYNKGYWHFLDGYLSGDDQGFVEFSNQADDLACVFCAALLKYRALGNSKEVEDFVRFARGVVAEILSGCEREDYNMTSYQFGEIVLLNKLYLRLADLLNAVENFNALRQL